MNDFNLGLSSLRQGYLLIRKNKDLWLWVFLPFLIYLALGLYSFSWGLEFIQIYTEKTLSLLKDIHLGFLVEILYYPLIFLLSLAFIVLIIYFIFSIGSVIAAPFNSILAEKTLFKLGLIEQKPFHFIRWIKLTIRMFFTSLLKSFLFLIIGVFIFISSFIPGLNLFAIYIALMVMAFDSLDYSFELLNLSLGRRLLMFRSNWLTATGLSAGFGLALIIPGLILLFLPVSVVGACYVLKKQSDKKSNYLSKVSF